MRLIILLLSSAVLLAACGGEEFQDLQDFVKNAGADMRGKVDPPPELKPYEPFTYDNSLALPDPFKPRKTETKSNANAGINQPDMERHREPLEEVPLENLKMVGYLYQAGVGHAIIRSPDGKLHRVKSGNYLGPNFGKIISVTDVEIKIKEQVQDSAGEWAERISTLPLME